MVRSSYHLSGADMVRSAVVLLIEHSQMATYAGRP